MIEKIKTYALAVFGVIAAIFAALFFFMKKKKDVSEAEKMNAEIKGRVEEIDKQISDLEKKTEEEKKNDSKDNILDFLNSKNKK